MTKIENGNNIKWTSKSGTVFYIHNINHKPVVFNQNGSPRKFTKEMAGEIELG